MKIVSKVKTYSLEFVDNLFSRKPEEIFGKASGKRFYFVDKKLFEFYHKQLEQFIGSDSCLLIDAAEPNKEYLALMPYYKNLIEKGFTRKDTLVTLGGGVLQDISGFIASTLYRGTKWAFFPTTLLAQADSCIGSKTSINFGQSKNLLGTFYPPDNIFLDVGFCQTLSDSEFNSGLGEIIKFHLLSDSNKYEVLKKYLAAGDLRQADRLKKIVLSTLEAKKAYFEEDEFDTGRRNLLNYGHCFGHALESASQFAVCHGEAVTVGMGFANLIARKRGLLTPKKYEEFENIFLEHYPRFALAKISINDLIHFMKHDKKRVSNDLTMILLHDIGKAAKHDDVKEEEVISAYEEFVTTYPQPVQVTR